MKIINPGYEIVHFPNESELRIEKAARVCYRSGNKIEPGSHKALIEKIIKNNHLSVLEHEVASVLFTVDRSTSHQLVRHRIAAFSQESQRYIKFSDDVTRLGQKELCVICPPSIQKNKNAKSKWEHFQKQAEKNYMELIKSGIKPEDARSVLTNATATVIYTTFNFRQWLHVFNDRALNEKAQWQIRELMQQVLVDFKQLCPAVFNHKFEELERQQEPEWSFAC